MSIRGFRLLSVALACSAALSFALSVFAAPDAEHPEHGAAPTSFNTFVPGAGELEGRIIAPCCWNQTIDIHGSEVSTTLRQEIRTRLLAGESKEAIERSLVNRYGARILAVPAGSRLSSAGILLSLAMGVGGVFAIVLLRRWQRRSVANLVDANPEGAVKPGAKGSTDRPAGSDSRARLDAEIDAELAKLDSD